MPLNASRLVACLAIAGTLLVVPRFDALAGESAGLDQVQQEATAAGSGEMQGRETGEETLSTPAPSTGAIPVDEVSATPSPSTEATPLQPMDLWQELKTNLGTTPEPTQRVALCLEFLARAPNHPRAAEVRDLVLGEVRAMPGSERLFLEPLLKLMDLKATEEERKVAAEQLGALGDIRAIIPLIYAANDRSVPVRTEVVTALGQYVHPSVEETLLGILKAGFPIPVAQAAADSLGAQKTETAREALYLAYRAEKAPREVRQAARESLDTWFPGYLASLGDSGKVMDKRGRYLLVPASAGFGAYAMGTVGRFGKANAAVPIGITSGLVLGGATAFWLTQDREMNYAQAASITTGGVWGLSTGLRVGRMLTYHRCDEEEASTQAAFNDPMAGDEIYIEYERCRERRDDLANLGGLMGEALGLTASILTLKRNPFSFNDMLTINLGGLAGHNAIFGLWLLTTQDKIETPAALATLAGGSLASLVGTAYVTRKLSFSEGDVLLVGNGTLQGAWFGGWLTSLIDPSSSDDAVAGGGLLGSSLGMVGSAYLAQHISLDAQDNFFMLAGSVYGNMLGAGIHLLADFDSDQARVGTMLAGGVAGLAATAALHNRVDFNQGDVALTTLGTGFGLWQGVGIATYYSTLHSSFSGQQISGAALLGTSLGGVATMALTQKIDPSAWEVLMVASGAMWGTWFSLWGNVLAHTDRSTLWLSNVIASDVGLAAGVVLLSPWIGVHPTRMGVANLAGMSGAAIASLGAALVTDDTDTIVASNLIGSAVGLGVGAIVASRMKVSGPGPAFLRGHRSLERLARWQPMLSFSPYYADSSANGSRRGEGLLLHLTLQQPVPERR